MSQPASSEVAQAIKHHREGSEQLRKAMFNLREGRPFNVRQTLIWSEPGGGKHWTQSEEMRPYLVEQFARAAKMLAERDAAISRAVSRDPCPKCGVRGDIGCRHK